MTTNDQIAGEARMIADNLAHKAACEWIRDDAPVAVRMTLRPEHLHALVRRIAALRAQPERGAEEMRERAAAVAHDEAAWMPYWEGQSIRFCIAAAIRALPLHPAKDEGEGR